MLEGLAYEFLWRDEVRGGEWSGDSAQSDLLEVGGIG